jgi:serine/threonine protein kinase
MRDAFYSHAHLHTINTPPADQHQHNFRKVFKARKAHSAQVVALKFISKHGKKQSDIAALRQEIAILTTIQHENIIMMFDAFETERDFVVATEYARGELFQILQDDHSLPEPQVRSIAIQLVNALQYLHSRRIIHRDMKPQNILISAEGELPLCYCDVLYLSKCLSLTAAVTTPQFSLHFVFTIAN